MSPLQRLRQEAEPVLVRLRDATGNTALCIGWQSLRMIGLGRARAGHDDAIPMQSPGQIADNHRNPLWGWLFRGADYWRRRRVRTLGSHDQHVCEAVFAAYAEHGWRYDPQPDRRRLTAPVHGPDGLMGALAIGGTAVSLPDSHIQEHGRTLLRYAQGLSDLMGARTEV